MSGQVLTEHNLLPTYARLDVTFERMQSTFVPLGVGHRHDRHHA